MAMSAPPTMWYLPHLQQRSGPGLREKCRGENFGTKSENRKFPPKISPPEIPPPQSLVPTPPPPPPEGTLAIARVHKASGSATRREKCGSSVA